MGLWVKKVPITTNTINISTSRDMQLHLKINMVTQS